MGRIKSGMIKRASLQLHEQISDFNTDFENNKKLLKGTMPSKSTRNKVAGQLVRLSKQKKLKENEQQQQTTK